jgi:membrane-associated protease RseP (regulator of RpoE activity)
LVLIAWFTTTTLGAVWFVTTRTDMTWDLLQVLTLETVLRVWRSPRLLHDGLLFSLATLFILGCHEMGHYIVARRRGMNVTPPFFLPAPFGIGTLGAFIRIRSAIETRRDLFDMAVAGPLAGFVALLPVLALGAARSTYEIVTIADSAQSLAASALVVPGRSLLLSGALHFFQGPAPADAVVNFHPFALAAWVGLFATSLNLLPLAQLDGGHLLYAWLGRHQRRLAVPLWVGLASLALLWPGWALWAAITLFLGLRHPPVRHDDETRSLGATRLWLGALAWLILVASFAPVPLEIVPLP